MIEEEAEEEAEVPGVRGGVGRIGLRTSRRACLGGGGGGRHAWAANKEEDTLGYKQRGVCGWALEEEADVPGSGGGGGRTWDTEEEADALGCK